MAEPQPANCRHARHEGSHAVVVLSEFAGAAAELKGAVLTNPHDANDLIAGLQQALAMPEDEIEGRQRQMFDIVERYDIQRWGQEFLAAVDHAGSGAGHHRYAMPQDDSQSTEGAATQHGRSTGA